MRRNDNTNPQASVTRFALGQTFITPGAEEAIQIAGQTELEFLRRHMSCDWGELSEDDVRENELSLTEGFRLLSAYQTGKGQKLDHHRSGAQRHHDYLARGILASELKRARKACRRSLARQSSQVQAENLMLAQHRIPA